jgi:hypothetical protein
MISIFGSRKTRNAKTKKKTRLGNIINTNEKEANVCYTVNSINSNHEVHKKIIQALRFVVCVCVCVGVGVGAC